MFIPIEMSTWARREHFEYYRTKIKCGYSCTVNLNVTNLLSQVKSKNLRFYPAFIFCVSKIINDSIEFRMSVDENGNPGYFDVSNPNITIFHEDTKTFSDMWTEYYPGFWEFYNNTINNMEKYKNNYGIKARDNQPQNFFCISCVPWLSYTAYTTSVPGGDPNLFPIITFGKYTEHNGSFDMPFTLNISHAAADGYHSSKFFNDLQKYIDTIEI